jgi:glutaredoxin
MDMEPKNSPKKRQKTPSPPVLGSRRMMTGAIIIAVIIALVAIILAAGNPGAPAAVSPQDCANTVISYVNTYLVQGNSTVAFTSVAEKNGVYEIATRYQGREFNLYATRDCSLLFTSTYNLKGSEPSAGATPSPTVPPEPVKSARPTVDLYVMAFCPYGTQAENAMEPVVGLLGSKINITVRYIASVQGTTIDSISSLHGPAEAKEDLRQLCIAKYYPSQLWPYLTDYNPNCVPLIQNAAGLDACAENATRKLGIDNQKIETCATGGEGLALLKADEGFTAEHQVTVSPTLIINGQIYSGARTPDAYRQAICAHFDTPPAECSVSLSSQAAVASGSCG